MDVNGEPGDRYAEEIEALKFLIGNACSRTINLLMQPEPDREALRVEMAFLGDKASRLADLLAGPPFADRADLQGPVGP